MQNIDISFLVFLGRFAKGNKPNFYIWTEIFKKWTTCITLFSLAIKWISEAAFDLVQQCLKNQNWFYLIYFFGGGTQSLTKNWIQKFKLCNNMVYEKNHILYKFENFKIQSTCIWIIELCLWLRVGHFLFFPAIPVQFSHYDSRIRGTEDVARGYKEVRGIPGTMSPQTSVGNNKYWK